MKRYTLLFGILLAFSTGFSQKQGNNWYFGDYAGLNFGMGYPQPLTNGALSTGEGCSSISTSSGNLEFYTDGRFVYNREHEQMPHGSGLFGHSSSTESGIIVPKPGSTTQYYVFTVDAYDNNLTMGLCYSRVDMTLEGGLGDVVTTEKNVQLLPYACEKVTAVGHDNGINFWVITHQWGSANFYAYEVTSAGVNTTPVISSAGPPLAGDMQASKGYIKVSPDGGKIAMANNTAFNVIICNFSNLSGTVSHIVTDQNYVNPGGGDPGGPYGVEFSPNSHLLYVGEWKANRRIWQYDVTSSDPQAILNSRVMVGSVSQNADPIGAMQIAPDNRMYVARQNSPYLSRINFPNIQGVGCEFQENAVNLGGRESTYGLPPFIQSFFFLSADYYWQVPACDGTPVQFYTSASDTPDSVLWNFGDPGSGAENTSELLNPTHLYPSTGSYWVTLLVYLYGVTKNVFHIVLVNEQPEVYIGNDTTLCAYDPFYIDAGPGFEQYLWQNGETTQVIEATETGWQWCQVTGEGGCTDTDSLYLVLNPVPDVNAGDDQTIPNGTSTVLDGSLTGGSGDFTIHWEPADKLLDPNVLQPTTINLVGTQVFTLSVTDNVGGCIAMDQVLINVLGGALACTPAAAPNQICIGESSQLHAYATGGSGSYQFTWTSTPTGFSSDLPDPVITPTMTTMYHLAVNDGFSIVTGSVTVTVSSRPVPDAGPDKSIPFGTATTLEGSAAGGSGYFNYHWEPANQLQNPNVQVPQTVILDATTLFTLTVTDQVSGCVSELPDDVTVTVTGNALNVNPVASPDTICSGETVQLYSLAGGGSGNYEYYWTSNPPGYNSVEENPIVSPVVTTVYNVSLTDGYTYVNGTTTVIVHPSPYVELGPDATVCVFDTLTLDAGNPGSTYIWSNGATDQVINVATTGIGFDYKTISVTITTPDGCSYTDTRNIVFDFAACSGVSDEAVDAGFRIYPNPGNGKICIENMVGARNCVLTVSDIYGRTVVEEQQIQFASNRKSVNIDLNSQAPGIYFIRISENGKNLVSMKYLLHEH